MWDERKTLLMNDIELLLSENNCTISDVKDIVKELSDEIKIQEKASYQYFRPTWALMLYGITEDVKKRLKFKDDFSKINPLNFVNVK